MWNNNNFEKLQQWKFYPVYLIARHSLHKFVEWGMWNGEEFICYGRKLDSCGWDFIAWYDLPEPELDKLKIYEVKVS